jgi:hypothetical protein
MLPHARLHDLRHLHATTLLLAGVPVHVVAARPGHADPSVTLRVYAHVIRDQVAAAADILRARSRPVTRPLLANPLARRLLPSRRRAVDLGALGGTRTPSLLIRSLTPAVRVVLPSRNSAYVLVTATLSSG